ncbi:MAG: GAF domain-containing protein [Chloroflexi bacterium]|nr:MAG: GAF domain-containing protein [Chloroflexota bacterium]
MFAHELSPDTKWRVIFDADAVVRALGGTTIGTAVAAGRWDEQAAFALLTRIDLSDGEALLCALRHGVPFDAVELATASSAAELLAMSVGDGRAMAEAKHESEQQNDRVALLEHLLTGLEETRDASSLLARAAEDISNRMGAGGTSIMLVEGNRLRVRASVGIGVPLGHEQRVDQGIAGWVASRGERVVLRGPVDDDRFRGSDPQAGESVIMPLRAGDEILGVLNVKRPTGDDGFGGKLDVLDAIAGDVARALVAIKRVDDLEREWRSEVALEDVMRHAAASDAEAAARTAASSFGHHAVVVRAGDGTILALHAEDRECREAALEASAKVEAPPGSGVRVGVARHDRPYEPSEEQLAGRAADALGLLAHAGVESAPTRHAGVRVLAVEDHPVMRLGVRALLAARSRARFPSSPSASSERRRSSARSSARVRTGSFPRTPHRARSSPRWKRRSRASRPWVPRSLARSAERPRRSRSLNPPMTRARWRPTTRSPAPRCRSGSRSRRGSSSSFATWRRGTRTKRSPVPWSSRKTRSRRGSRP